MKRTHLILLFLCACAMVQAQESSSFQEPFKEKNKLIQLDVDLGGHFDLAYRREGNMLTALSDQGAKYGSMNLRLQHFFARKWGWYAAVHLGFAEKYSKEGEAELTRTYAADYYVDPVRYGVYSKVNPSLDAGVVYRIENSRWAFYPRFGVGVSGVECEQLGANLKKKGSNELYRIEYRVGDENDFGNSNVDAFILSFGFSVNYKLSRYCYLLLNANYKQPLGNFTSYEQMTNLYTDESKVTRMFKSSTLMRDLNVSIGIGIPIYLGRNSNGVTMYNQGNNGNGKTTRKERMRNIMEQKKKAFGMFPTTKKHR